MHNFKLTSDVVTVDRVSNAEIKPTDIVVGWADVAPDQLPTLTIHQRWSAKQGRWMETTSYGVAEIPVGNGFDGRGFHLVKLADHDGEQVLTDESYDLFVSRNGQDDICDCKGHTYSHHCKHVDAMRFIIERGILDLATDAPADEPTIDEDPFEGVLLTGAVEIPF